MAEYLSDADYWKCVALEQALEAARARVEKAAVELQGNAVYLNAKYGIDPEFDRVEPRNGNKCEIVRGERPEEKPPLEAVK